MDLHNATDAGKGGASGPLVSIGVPTFNRPVLLARAISDARQQTYRNLEIIISDNASTDPIVEQVCRAAESDDSRVSYIRQPTNIGPMANFEFTLTASKGEYFAWFADDDGHDTRYVERLLAAHGSVRRATALVGCEARYETSEGDFTFFSEGERFYDGLCPGETNSSVADRVSAATRLGYGNIIYGLYRRDAMFQFGHPATHWFGPSLNELPFYVMIAAAGDMICIPDVLIAKRAPMRTCRDARWEQQGGLRPGGPQINVHAVARYHRKVFNELARAYGALDLSKTENARLFAEARRSLTQHAATMVVGWKPKRRSVAVSPAFNGNKVDAARVRPPP